MNKTASFVGKVRLTVIILLTLFTLYIVSIHLYYSYTSFQKKSKELQKNFLEHHKKLIKTEVNRVVEMIDIERTKSENIGEKIVKEEVKQAYNIIKNVYGDYQKLNKDDIIKILKSVFTPVRHDSGNRYFFILDINGNVILNPASPELNGKNVTHLKDSNGKYFIREMIHTVETKGEGFVKYFWRKPGRNRKKLYKKISFVKIFKPLNIFIGTGIYLNDLEERIPDNVLYYVQNHRFGKDERGYIFILKLLNINGGKNFAIMTVNANRPDLIGKYISDDYQDAKGKKFRKEFLKGLREHGECFVKYWYKKLGCNKISPKLSFFQLTSDKKFIVGAGVYLDDISKRINFLKANLKKENLNKVILFVSSVSILLLIFIIILNQLSKRLKEDFYSFINLFRNSTTKNKLIEKDKLEFREFKLLSENINEILKEKFKLIQEIELSEAKFRKIFEESKIPMLLLDKDRFIDCNNEAIKMLAAKRKDEILKHPGDFSPEHQPDGSNSKEKAKQIIEEVYATGEKKQFEWLHKRLNGELFWSMINLNLIPYQDREIIFVIWVDISEIKTLQNKLEEEKEKLAVTLYSIGDAVVTTDVNGKVEFMNKVAERLTGWNISEAKGKDLSEIFVIINEQSRKIVANPVEKVIKENKIVALANHTVLIAKDGTEYNIADSAAPIRDRESNIVGVVLVFRDETEKHKLKNEILKSEKLKTVSTLAAGIAHDFNNILSGIYSNIELAMLQIDDKVKLLKRLKLTGDSLERAKKLTNQLLTFAKGGIPTLKPANISHIIKDVVDFNLSGSNIKIHYNIPDDLWNVEVDKEQISEVISNLVINAKHSMEDNGNLYISMENMNEEETHKLFGKFAKFVKITIKDSGKGIPKNIINKIFDPFFSTKKKGSGLGLSVVQSIIDKHHGFMKVDSLEGKGTAFTIFLPATEEKSEESSEDEVSKDKLDLLSDKSILIMDDEYSIRETSKDLLENFGVSVETAANGEEAVAKYKDKKFDIVIMDLTIPGGMGGKEAVNEILKIDSSAKVIVSSGYFNDPVLANYKEYGFKGVIMKPYKIKDTLQEIVKVLNL